MMTLWQKISEIEQAGNLPRLSSIVTGKKIPKRVTPKEALSPGHLLWIDGEEITAGQGLTIRHIDIT